MKFDKRNSALVEDHYILSKEYTSIDVRDRGFQKNCKRSLIAGLYKDDCKALRSLFYNGNVANDALEECTHTKLRFHLIIDDVQSVGFDNTCVKF